MTNSVLIIEDHPLYRDALIPLLEEVFDDSKVMAATSAEEGLSLAAKLPNLRLILLDLNLPGLCGREAVAAFYQSYPRAITIVISSSEDRRDVSASLRAGARAFISKHVSRTVMLDTIHRALSGKLSNPEWVRPSHQSVVVDEQTLPLNQRQLGILTLLARGCTNREIAAQVGLAEITVKQHITVIFRVLGVENRSQALLAIRRFGLVPD
ncbi:MAG: DNA-binding response regulator [Solimicrobium sp.]|jgi:DNA-binding NarL/FixJ family response regulator|nr:DNA-binding response regulator [Solimicrobium sp.]